MSFHPDDTTVALVCREINIQADVNNFVTLLAGALVPKYYDWYYEPESNSAHDFADNFLILANKVLKEAIDGK